MKNSIKQFAAATIVGAFVWSANVQADAITVQKGDTLYSLAKKYKISVEELKKVNHLTSNTLSVGQILVLSTESDTTTSSTRTHVVKEGETLYRIGVNYDVSVTDLSKWNKLSSSSLTIGQTLYVIDPAIPPTTYVVKAGDSLYQVGIKYKVDYKVLMKWNNLSSASLTVGQELYVTEPLLTSPTLPDPVTPPTTPVVNANTPLTYTVQSGDYLYKVAEKYNLTLAQLRSLNSMTGNIIYTNQKLKVSKSQFMRPATGRVSSGFGSRWGTHHDGLDFAEFGNVDIQASADGVVSRSYYSSSYGNVVFIVHNINGKTYETVYAHMRNRLVSEGQKVTQGTKLGLMGTTGHSTGQHLHFELHEGRWNAEKSDAIDPAPFFVQ